MTDLDLDVIEARYNDWYERGYNDIPLTDEDASTLYPHGDYGDETRSHYIVRNDVPGLVAEVRRLRETVEALAQSTSDLGRDLLIEGERADAARAEAERLRERINGQAETISKLGQVAAEAGRVMEALQAHGPSIVGHLLDTDDNAGERLRELLREVSEWALNGTTASTPLRAEIERLRVEAGRVREALQAVRAMHTLIWRKCALDYELWPCATVRALDAALDGAE